MRFPSLVAATVRAPNDSGNVIPVLLSVVRLQNGCRGMSVKMPESLDESIHGSEPRHTRS